jgi:hypothetical protein
MVVDEELQKDSDENEDANSHMTRIPLHDIQLWN